MSSNAVYDAFEDELVKCLEAGALLPTHFTITLAEDEFKALIVGGLMDPETGQRMPATVTKVYLKMADKYVTVRSEKDPEEPIPRS